MRVYYEIKACGCEALDSELKRRKYDIIVCDFTMQVLMDYKWRKGLRK